MQPAYLYIERVRKKSPEEKDEYPFNIPAIRGLKEIEFHSPVTFFVGENGMGKSTLIEAIAVKAGFNPEGGSRNFSFSTMDSHSLLYDYIVLSKSCRRNKDGYFLRAESYYNVASEIERLDEGVGGPPVKDSYGGKSLHKQSHGESFMALLKHRLFGDGLYIFDEPEAALSPLSQLMMMARIHELAELRSQFIIATHSPILMGYPGAEIYRLSSDGIEKADYRFTEHYLITRSFLENPERILQKLLSSP